jgi:phthalate 4,5-dioxygenase
MLTKEENELLTQIGPGTLGGDLLRRYWQAVELSDRLPLDSAPQRIRLLGEDLVLFRDDQGKPGLLGLHCPPRRADLSYGRVEDGGLRCIYHGWLFDVRGRCLEQPSEPGPGFKDKVHHLAYPCQEVGGIVFAYLGPGEPPLFPQYEPFRVPPDHRYVTKILHNCSYFQANEGNLDPCHTSFLHRQLNAPPKLKRPVQGTEGTLPMHFYIRDPVPTIEIEDTDFGLRILSFRGAEEGKTYFRVTNFIFPNLATIVGPMSGDGYNLYWHVPIDDTHHWRYDITFRRSAPLDADDRQRIKEIDDELDDDHRPIRNEANRYLQDRESMKSWSYSGMGRIFNVQDTAIVEGQGAIVDRSQEQLGSSDKALIAARRLFFKAIENIRAGQDPLGLVRDAKSNGFPNLLVLADIIPASEDWKSYWEREASSASRRQAP